MTLTSDIAKLIPHSLPLFCHYASGGEWLPHPHTRIICDRLERLMNPDDSLQRIILELPPRHGKSFLSAHLFPCFYLSHNPTHEVQILAHGSHLAEQWGSRTKWTFDNMVRPLWGHKVSRDSRAKSHWRVEGTKGGVNAVGVEGSVLGQGANLLIIDDPYKSVEEAQSPRVREQVWDWYTGTLRSRLFPGAGIVVIHQRLHPEDLIGRIKAQIQDTGEEWEILSFPAIATEDEYIDGDLFRLEGDPLCPGMIPRDHLLMLKDGMSNFKWEAMYQQNPVQGEGAFWPAELFDDSIFIDEHPKDVDHLVVAIDPSMGRGDADHDFQAIVSLATNGSGLFFSDCWQVKATPSQIAINVVKFIQTRLPRIPDVVAVEDEAGQELLVAPLMEQFKKHGIWTTVELIQSGKVNKQLRIRRLDPFIEKRRLRWVRSQGTYLMAEQFKVFPNKKEHDDGPDALEMAFECLSRCGAVTGVR